MKGGQIVAKTKTISDEAVISALLSCPTWEAAAVQCRLSVRQLYERRQRPEFIQQLKAAQSNALSSAARYLQHSTGNAAAVLLEIAENQNENAQVRVTAARAILEQVARFTEVLDFAERLEALEQVSRSHN